MNFLQKLTPNLKETLRNFGRTFGLDIRLSGLNSREDLRFVHFLKMHDIKTVLDIGANRGQFATSLFKSGYEGRIISFEPLPDTHATLINAAKAYGNRWQIGPCVALSSCNGKAEFFVTGADSSSSLLQPLKSFVDATPAVEVEKRIEVETKRLDDLLPELEIDLSRSFMKIDVQGSEALVLEGATDLLSKIKGVLIEISFTDLYAGQSSATNVQRQMIKSGFEIWDIWRGYHNPHTYRLNQVDVLFFRSELARSK